MERTTLSSSQEKLPIWADWETPGIDDYQPGAGLGSDNEEDDNSIFSEYSASSSSSSSSSSSTYSTKHQFSPSLACPSSSSTIEDLAASGRVQKIEQKRGILEGITRIFIGIIAGLAHVLSLGCFTQLGNFACEQVKQGTNLLYPPQEYYIPPRDEKIGSSNPSFISDEIDLNLSDEDFSTSQGRGKGIFDWKPSSALKASLTSNSSTPSPSSSLDNPEEK